eukprot:CAMPEP_0183720662 /NCGR_PEP_ID=MMETSP0737-20130205/13202_1 /TAXON_ID=385413 /ORGANISM="Thalassiosira miniscula, Strain CCMP1093" /LENGTH=593 /DNA_ID=CAMNT_0025950555 /DNA_START=49 /DNA_END=1830 /DNA_ORIENTATION=-
MDYPMELSGERRELYPLLNYTDSGYFPEPYIPSSDILSTHNLPRYGFTNNFGALIHPTTDNDQQREYILGIIIGAIIILCVALLWFFVIVVLRILGQEKVGFFAGRFVRPARSIQPQDDDGNEEKDGIEVVMAPGGREHDDIISEAVLANGTNDSTADEPMMNNHTVASENNVEKKFLRTVLAVRLLFVLSGIVVIISGGIFYGKGVVRFEASLNEIQNGIDLVQEVAYKTIKLSDEVIQSRSDIEKEMDPTREIVESSEEICGLTAETTQLIRTAYLEFQEHFAKLTTMLDNSLENFNDDLKDLVALTEQIEYGLNSAEIFHIILILITVVIIVLIVAMQAGAFFAWKGNSNCFTRCIQYAIIWPLFVFFLFLGWIFALLFLTFSLAGADFCVDPDHHVETLLHKNAEMFDSIIFGFMIYYISGCQIMPPGKDDIIEVMEQVKVVLYFAHKLTELTENLPIEAIAIACGLGTADARALQALISLLHEGTHVLNRAIVGLRTLLACETFNPIYTTFVHDALCAEGVTGITYIFSSALVIAIFSMVMVMLRAALYPIKEHHAKPASRSEDAIQEDNYSGNSPENENEKEKAVIF